MNQQLTWIWLSECNFRVQHVVFIAQKLSDSALHSRLPMLCLYRDVHCCRTACHSSRIYMAASQDPKKPCPLTEWGWLQDGT